jgi:hypothetical protein
MPDDMGVRKTAVVGSALVIALTWAGFFTWEGLFPQVLSSWIGEVPGATVVRLLRLLSQVAWWQVVTLFVAILIGSCSNWLEGVLEWRTYCASARPRNDGRYSPARSLRGACLQLRDHTARSPRHGSGST